MLIFSIVYLSLSITIQELPSSGSAPPPLVHPTSILDMSSVSYSFGGKLQDGTFSSTLYSFNVQSKTWSEIVPSTTFSPPGLSNSYSFKSKNKFFSIFGLNKRGIIKEFYSFDLQELSWQVENYTGHITPSIFAASLVFSFNSKNYFALFGGVSMFGENNNFYLINIDTLEVSDFTGNSIGNMTEAALVYFNGSLLLLGVENSEWDFCKLYRWRLGINVWEEVKTFNMISGRKGHKVAIYLNFMYVFFGYGLGHAYSEVNRLNLITLKWELINTQDYYIYGSNFHYDSGYAVFGLGSSLNKFENSVRVYSFQNNKFKFYTETDDFPVGRKNHLSFEYQNDIFIFGGLSNDGVYLNDMWRFSLSTNKWKGVMMLGIIPDGRELMGYYFLPGEALFLYGGRDDLKIFNDLYYYIPITSSWVQLSNGFSELPPRYSPCMYAISYFYFIFGGRDDVQTFNDIWVYSISTSQIKQINLNINTEFNLMSYKCVQIIQDNGFDLFIIGGTNFSLIPSNKVYKLTAFYENLNSPAPKVKTEFSCILDNPKINTNDYGVIQDNSIIYLIGGISNQEYLKNMLVLNTKNNSALSFIETPNKIWISGHSLIQIGTSFYIFGGTQSDIGYQLTEKYSKKLFKVSFENDPRVNLTCKAGGVEKGICAACKPGYTSVNQICTPCFIGSFYPNEGASEMQMCIPCKFGHYNDKTGQSYCRECPSKTFCPIGSTSYQVTTPSLMNYTSQPALYQPNTEIDKYYLNFIYVYFPICFCLLALVVIAKPLKGFFTKLDMFTSQHSHTLEKPVVFKKTYIGGFFSFIFLFFGIATVSYTSATYFYNNIVESQSLVPSLTQNTTISAEYIQVYLKYYGLFHGCNSGNASVSFSNSHATSSKIEFTLVENDCEVSLNFTDISFTGNAELNITFNNILVYSNMISVYVSVVSSIPRQLSEVFIVTTPENNKLFRGTTPSIFNLLFYPSIFNSDSRDYPSRLTGFHISDMKSHSKGSTVDEKSIFATAFLSSTINFILSDTVLITNRLLNNTAYMFIGTLLGSILGFMGSFASVMAWTEDFSLFLDRRKTRKIVSGEGVVKRMAFQFDNQLSKENQETVLDATST